MWPGLCDVRAETQTNRLKMRKTFEENDGAKCEIRANGVFFAPILVIAVLWPAFAERTFGQQEILEWRTNDIPRSSFSTSSFVDIAYGNGRYVAVGQQGVTLVSEDAINWRTNTVDSVNFSAIEFGNDRFVALQGPLHPEGPPLVSNDGLRWQSFQTNYLGCDLHFFKGQFISCQGSNIVTSVDGVNWEKTGGNIGGPAGLISDDGSRVYFWGFSTVWADGDFVRAVPLRTKGGAQDGAFGRGTLLIRRSGIYRFDGELDPGVLSPPIGEGGMMSGLAFGDGNFVVSAPGGKAIISRDAKNWRTNSIGVTGKMKFVNHRFFCLSGATIAVSNELAPPPPNTPPEVGQPPDFVVNEGKTLRFSISAYDPDFDGPLSYRLGSEAPDGAQIDWESGLFRWETTEASGPSTNKISIYVVDAGEPPGVTRRDFTIVVKENNRAPVLDQLVDRFVFAEPQKWIFNTSDYDLPKQNLIWRLAEGPSGVELHEGELSWSPTSQDINKTHNFAIEVTDSGEPALTASNPFQVTVLDPRLKLTLTNGNHKPFAQRVEYNEGVWLALNTDNSLSRSTNIAVWIPEQTASRTLRQEAGHFFSFRDATLSLGISTDGHDWKSIVTDTKEQMFGVSAISFGDLYYAGAFQGCCGTTTFYRSTNATKWFSILTTKSNIIDSAYGNGRFVFVGTSCWYLGGREATYWVPFEFAGTLAGVAFGGGKFVMIADHGRFLTSTYGEEWEERVWSRDVEFSRIRREEGKFLVLGRSQSAGNYFLLISDDGVAWREVGSGTVSLNDVSLSPDFLVVAAPKGLARFPRAALDQTSLRARGGNSFRITWGNIGPTEIQSSSDLVHWDRWTNFVETAEGVEDPQSGANAFQFFRLGR
jgi:hypothetical protein